MCHLVHETWDILLSGIYMHVFQHQAILKCANSWSFHYSWQSINLTDVIAHFMIVLIVRIIWDIFRDHETTTAAWPQQQQHNIGPGGRSSPAQQQHNSYDGTAVESCSCFWTAGEQSWWMTRNIKLPWWLLYNLSVSDCLQGHSEYGTRTTCIFWSFVCRMWQCHDLLLESSQFLFLALCLFVFVCL